MMFSSPSPPAPRTASMTMCTLLCLQPAAALLLLLTWLRNVCSPSAHASADVAACVVALMAWQHVALDVPSRSRALIGPGAIESLYFHLLVAFCDLSSIRLRESTWVCQLRFGCVFDTPVRLDSCYGKLGGIMASLALCEAASMNGPLPIMGLYVAKSYNRLQPWRFSVAIKQSLGETADSLSSKLAYMLNTRRVCGCYLPCFQRVNTSCCCLLNKS